MAYKQQILTKQWQKYEFDLQNKSKGIPDCNARTTYSRIGCREVLKVT